MPESGRLEENVSVMVILEQAFSFAFVFLQEF